MQVELLNDQGQAASKYDAPETVFGREYNEDLVHQIVVAYQANARQGTRAQKDREQVKHHDLVNQIFVVFTTEHGFWCVVFRRSLTLVIQEFDLHQFAPLALTAGCTVTKPPAEPGTAPRINNSWRASSMRITSRF